MPGSTTREAPEFVDLSISPTDDTHAPPGPPCPACGAPHDKTDRFCIACGTELLADEAVESAPPVSPRASPAIKPKQKHFRCKNCGAEVATDPGQRSYTCAFCDSTYVVEYAPDETGRIAPEFVIGFEITHEQALEKFKQWLTTNSWFRPGDLKAAKIEEKLRGVYLPFWSFPMLARSRWKASIGEHWYRTETYTTVVNGKTVTRTRQVQETEWWPLEGEHHQYYSGFLVSGSRGLPQGEAERIKPYYLPALKRYEPFYLAGWLAEEYSFDVNDAMRIAKNEYAAREQANVANFLPGDTHRELALQTTFSDVSSDLILLPIYILSYRYRDEVFRFLLNGQTGKADGDKPVSGKRITSAVIGALLLIAMTTLLLWWIGR